MLMDVCLFIFGPAGHMEPTRRLCQALLHQSSRQLCCRLTSPSRFTLTPSSRSLSTTSAPGDGGEGRARVLGIRREESNVWERRAPLSPNHVQSLISKGVKVLIQPSSRRGYTVREYQKAGAVVTDDLSQADTIVGVKQPPLEHLIDDKTFVIFSHTIKAQPENMPLLDAILQKRIRLVDYECLLNEKKQRLVAFGQYAGVAGMINILHGLGVRLLCSRPQHSLHCELHIGYAHNYSSSSSAKAAVATVGKEIQLGMYPESLGPMIFTFTGAGNVSQGAQEVFKELPHEYVSPLDLQNVVETGDCHKVYATVVDKADHLYRLAGGDYDDEEFEKFPDRYDSIFADKPNLLPSPVHMDTSVLKLQGVPALPQRLLAVADISCDLHGSLEFMSTVTTIDNPSPCTMYTPTPPPTSEMAVSEEPMWVQLEQRIAPHPSWSGWCRI
ncbi:Alpha-aminoadipic semialdehyde synthase, mitochondrial [Geodia barretti]|uniref:Alpha-aminoadipic semialdehyde synthase, mitochondrial n=1 Tax=Geodia barretti TaxID=519541 RepID=A0AA35TNK6_GEOBA|nr:Alpha-aminoadipic semialdehyde synthase, mitochondrial [Geodia barretti]